jgi:hypothetical protein
MCQTIRRNGNVSTLDELIALIDRNSLRIAFAQTLLHWSGGHRVRKRSGVDGDLRAIKKAPEATASQSKRAPSDILASIDDWIIEERTVGKHLGG